MYDTINSINYQVYEMLITDEGVRPQNQTRVFSMSNREMAAVLFNIASVLKQSGNVNPYRTAAYERGARALMGLRREASEVLASRERIAFRRRQHIGDKLHSKINEMVAKGELDQYQDMLAHLPLHQRELMTVPGIGPKLADLLFTQLGVSTAAELVRSARDGRLKEVAGFGVKRISRIASMSILEDYESAGQLSLFD
jgi:DNA polymerase (family 10)